MPSLERQRIQKKYPLRLVLNPFWSANESITGAGWLWMIFLMSESFMPFFFKYWATVWSRLAVEAI